MFPALFSTFPILRPTNNPRPNISLACPPTRKEGSTPVLEARLSITVFSLSPKSTSGVSSMVLGMGLCMASSLSIGLCQQGMMGEPRRLKAVALPLSVTPTMLLHSGISSWIQFPFSSTPYRPASFALLSRDPSTRQAEPQRSGSQLPRTPPPAQRPQDQPNSTPTRCLGLNSVGPTLKTSKF